MPCPVLVLAGEQGGERFPEFQCAAATDVDQQNQVPAGQSGDQERQAPEQLEIQRLQESRAPEAATSLRFVQCSDYIPDSCSKDFCFTIGTLRKPCHN